MVSVIIPTLNRNTKILHCLHALLINTSKQFEIIVLDQNKNLSPSLKRFIQAHTSVIRYIKTHTKNKALAINKAIMIASGSIIAFTDDDCIVSPAWINTISTTFSAHPDIACMTGNTYPYGSISIESCPPTIKTKTKQFSKPQIHTAIGYGNNFAIRASTMKNIGLFKTWLGPGSIGSNCEDGEMILRLLIHKQKILHNENMIVYHDKNLSGNAYRKQQCSYVCGEMACYSYYMLAGWKFARRVIQSNVLDSYHDSKQIIGDMCKRKTIYIENWIYSVQLFCSRLKGFTVGIFYFLAEGHLT